MIKTNQRNYGIDLLRIVSMMMVCTLHILDQGGAMNDTYYDIRVAQLIQAMSYGASNCFALISGYVGVDAKVKYRSIFRLWMQVVFYCVGITLVMHVMGIQTMKISDLKAAITPALSRQYWYFTAYFFMFFFIPYLNKLIHSLTQKELSALALSIVFFFSIFQTMTRDVYQTNQGYGIWWLTVLYLLGGCMRKLRIEEKSFSWRWPTIYFLCAFITFCYRDKLLTYISPTVLVGCIALVFWFSRLKFGPRLCKIISALVPISFGVYLIHVHPLVFHNVIPGMFAPLSTLRTRLFIIALPVCVLGLYGVCTLVDAVRGFLFQKLGINLLCEKIEKLLLYMWDKIYEKLPVNR